MRTITRPRNAPVSLRVASLDTGEELLQSGVDAELEGSEAEHLIIMNDKIC